MKPAERLEEVRKQLKLVAQDSRVSDLQAEAIIGVADVVTALLDSMRLQRDGELMTDGGPEELDEKQPRHHRFDNSKIEKQLGGQIRTCPTHQSLPQNVDTPDTHQICTECEVCWGVRDNWEYCPVCGDELLRVEVVR